MIGGVLMKDFDEFDGFSIKDEIDKLGSNLDYEASFTFDDDDEYLNTALDKTNPGLLQKIRRDTLDPYAPCDTPIKYKLLEFDSLDELCRAYGVDTELFIQNVQSGMSLDEAFNKGLALADCSNIEEQKEIQERKRQERINREKAQEKNRQVASFLEYRLRELGRQCHLSDGRVFIPNNAMLGSRRRLFVAALAHHISPAYEKDTANIALKSYNFEVSFSEFMSALRSFLNDAFEKCELSVNNKDIFRLFCNNMWAGDMLFGEDSVAPLVVRADTEDLDSLMQERELEAIQTAMSDPIYAYFMANSIPTDKNKHVFWSEELAGILGFKDRVDYVDVLLEDFSIDFLIRCQQQQMYVRQSVKENGMPDYDYEVFMQGVAEVEYLYDVKIRSFYKHLMGIMPPNPDMAIDVTDAVKSLGVQSKTKALKSSASLWTHYNKYPCYDKDEIMAYARAYYRAKNRV